MTKTNKRTFQRNCLSTDPTYINGYSQKSDLSQRYTNIFDFFFTDITALFNRLPFAVHRTSAATYSFRKFKNPNNYSS